MSKGKKLEEIEKKSADEIWNEWVDEMSRKEKIKNRVEEIREMIRKER